MKSLLLCLVIGILAQKVVHSIRIVYNDSREIIAVGIPNIRCQGRADVGFIVDASGSLESEYHKEKSFVKTLANRFGLGERASHAGIVVFSDKVELSVTFAEKNNAKEFNDAVDKLPDWGARTRLDKALKVAYDELFQPKNGMRLDVKQVMFVLTDGEQTKTNGSVSPAQAIAPFHESDIKVVVIGVGSHVNRTELRSMVKSEKDLYFAKNFDELISSKFVDDITTASCQKADKCTKQVDVGFIVDSSGSLRSDHKKEKEFVKALADTFSISKEGSRASIITFNSNAAINVKFSDHETVADFQKAVDGLPNPTGKTRIDKALKLARDELLTSKYGARENVPKLLVLLTDGTQTTAQGALNPGDIAAELRQSGVRLIVIGVGKKVNTEELLHIAGEKFNLYQASDFDVLKSFGFVESVSKTACKLSEKPFQCNATVDIGFIMDSVDASESTLLQQRLFLKSIAKSFTTSSYGSRFGLIPSDDLSNMVKFKYHRHASEFSIAVDLSARSVKRTMKLDKAIDMAYKDLFNPANGARPEVLSVLVVLSARNSSNTNPRLLSKAISRFQEENTKVLVVSTEAGASNPFLRNLASNPTDVYVAEKANDLSKISFQTKVAESACRATVGKCKNVANIGFILDSSGSLRRDYGKEKEFVKQLAESFEISEAGSRAGVVIFSHRAELTIAMNKHTSVNDFNKAVDEIAYMGTTTRIDRGLKLAKEQLMVGARLDAPRIVFLLTDGSQTASADAIDPAIVAKQLRDDGIQLIVIGIGKRIEVTELYGIAGNNANVYLAKDFDELKSREFVQRITKASCDKAEETLVCKEVADVGFIVDSSGSLKNDYQKEKDFVKSVASSLDISPTGSHVSVVTFSNIAKLNVKFSDHTNYKDFKSAVDGLKLLKSTTRIDRALAVAYDNMFNEQNGMRVKVPKVLILLTDGEQTKDAGAINPAKAVARFHDAGIKVIVIGIGKNVVFDELKRMVKSRDNLFRAADFEQLKSDQFVKSIIGTTCRQISATQCDIVADIGFVVDSSASVRYHYDKEKAFVKILSDTFSISAEGSRAGVVVFSTTAELSVKLSDHKSGSDFKNAVDGLEMMNHTTRIDRALTVAKEQLFSRANGSRARVAKILIVLTDGAQTQGGDAVDPSTIAKTLRESGITVVAVGIGNKVKISELKGIAGDESRLFLAKNFDQLVSAEFLKKAANITCKEAEIEEPKVKCQAKADVGFVVDSSGSLRSEYDKEKSFVKSLAYRFGLSKNGSHAGVVRFSHKAEVRVTLAEKNSITEFTDAVDNLPHWGFTTRIDEALRVSFEELFQPKNGMRSGVPKVVFILTDGKQTNAAGAESPAQAIIPFHESNMKVVVIGIGSGVNRQELTNMARSDKDIYFAKDFDELISSQFVDNVTALSCQKAEKCKNQVDVGFIVDSSGSVKRNHLKEKEFVKALADTFSISKDGCRAAVITFNSKAAINVRFSDHETVADFQKAVDGLPEPTGKTRIDKALKLAKDELLQSKNGARENVPKLLVLLTDGKQTDDADAIDPGNIATELKQSGVRLIVIGIGNEVDDKELLHMAGEKSNIYKATDFNELKSFAFVESVSKTGCKLSEKAFKCSATVDIGFVLDPVDASKNTLFEQRLFLKRIEEAFTFSPNGSRFGLIASDDWSEMIRFGDHKNARDFNQAVNKLTSSGINAMKLGQAIEGAVVDLFNPSNGARKGVPKVLIVLSARKSSSIANPALLSKTASLLRKDKTKVLVVSIGQGANNPHLRSLASDPNDFYEAGRGGDLSGKTLQTAVAEAACRATVAKCKNVANIGFIVDSSGSLHSDFWKEKEFVKQLAESFEISEAGSRAGVVFFSQFAKLSIAMNQYRSVNEFNKAVDNEELMGKSTRIDRALLLAKEQLMVGARSDAPRIVFLLTDGSQTNSIYSPMDPAIVAKQLRDDGIQLIVIGIGNEIGGAELQAIAGSKLNLYLAKDLNELKSRSFVQRLSKASCDKTVGRIGEVKCQAKADVGFVVDSSGSLRSEYDKEKSFVKSLAYRFGLSAEGSHAGVVRFSHKAEVRVTLAEKNSVTEFNEAIDLLPHWGYTTRIDEALKVAYNELFQPGNGMRLGVPRVVFILTDGRQTNEIGAVSPAQAVAPFHESDIKVVVIGIGSGVNRNQLKSMVQSEKDIYFAKNFDELISSKFVDDITAASCQRSNA